eukprot:scaffold699_cov385-Prasinococcus_capsulatus_cf.AAC.11
MVDALDELSAEELRGQLHSALKEAGILREVKCHMRQTLLAWLRRKDMGVLCKGRATGDASPTQRVLDSLVSDYLKTRGMSFTLSLFAAEAELLAEATLPAQELARQLGVDGAGTDSDQSVLGRLIQQRQDDAELGAESGSQTAYTAGRRTMERQLKDLDKAFVVATGRSQMPEASIEDTMERHRLDCERRMQLELNAQVARVREIEVGRVRMEEQARFRKQVETMRNEWQAAHAEHVRSLARREDAMVEAQHRRERELEIAAHQHRTRILAEAERLAARQQEFSNAQAREQKHHHEREVLLREREASLKERYEALEHVESRLRSSNQLEFETKEAALEQEYAAKLQLLDLEKEELNARNTKLPDKISPQRPDSSPLLVEDAQNALNCDPPHESALEPTELSQGASALDRHQRTLAAEQRALLKEREKRRAMRRRLADTKRRYRDDLEAQKGHITSLLAENAQRLVRERDLEQAQQLAEDRETQLRHERDRALRKLEETQAQYSTLRQELDELQQRYNTIERDMEQSRPSPCRQLADDEGQLSGEKSEAGLGALQTMEALPERTVVLEEWTSELEAEERRLTVASVEFMRTLRESKSAANALLEGVPTDGHPRTYE